MKLDVEKLSEVARSIKGTYTNFNANNCLLELECSAFNNEFKVAGKNFVSHGTLLNKNTVETFKDSLKDFDKAEILRVAGEQLYDKIIDGSCLEDPSLLVPFVLLSYAVSCPQENFIIILFKIFILGPEEIQFLLLVCFPRLNRASGTRNITVSEDN